MRILALVTARGGSKGFPGKNIALLAGRPLTNWAYQILARVQKRFTHMDIFLSTDSKEIAQAWPDKQQPHRLRPENLATDTATSIDVVLYELEMAEHEQKHYDAVLLLQPTSPLIDEHGLFALIDLTLKGDKSAVIAGLTDHPLDWAVTIDNDGFAQSTTTQNSTLRRQHCPAAYIPSGAYIALTSFLKEYKSFIVSGQTKVVPISQLRAIDIDYIHDLDYATCNLKLLHKDAPFFIGSRYIGGDYRCFIIAEAGINHNGSIITAKKLIRAAHEAGADAIKFQTFKTEQLVTSDAPCAEYQIGSSHKNTQFNMLRRYELSKNDFTILKQYAESFGLIFLSTPFDIESAKFLSHIGMNVFKIGSGELTNFKFLDELARLEKPLIVSTGMCTLEEVEQASSLIHDASPKLPVAWLHCISAYPAPDNQTNLRAMDSLRLAVGGPVGFSDHSLGIHLALAATARGAKVIEKHLTLDTSDDGPDHQASITPLQFAAMVRQIRGIESALGTGCKVPSECERNTAQVARRSLVSARAMQQGHTIQASDLAAKRPGTGLSPALLPQLIGKTLKADIPADTIITLEHII